MNQVAVVIALAALGVALWWGPLGGSGSPPREEAAIDGGTSLRAELAALREELAALRDRPSALGPSTQTAPRATGLAVQPDAPTPGADKAEGGVTWEKAISDRIAAVEAFMESERAKTSNGRHIPAPVLFGGSHKMIANVDQAETHLDLSAGQKADMQDALKDLRDQMAELQDIPNEEGATLRELNKAFRDSLESAAKNAAKEGRTALGLQVGDHLGKVSKFMSGTIPGRNETYAQASQRLRKEAKSRVRDTLDREQRATWDRSVTEPLFPSAAGMTSGSSVVMSVGGWDAEDGR